jgi:hypothetical protein
MDEFTSASTNRQNKCVDHRKLGFLKIKGTIRRGNSRLKNSPTNVTEEKKKNKDDVMECTSRLHGEERNLGTLNFSKAVSWKSMPLKRHGGGRGKNGFFGKCIL